MDWPSTNELLDRLYADDDPDEVVLWDMPSFLAAYTLHDSHLTEVRFEQTQGMLVLIDWDLHWNKAVLPEYQNLLIGIPMLYSVHWNQGSWHQSTLDGATSDLVPEVERRRMLDDGSVDLRAYQGVNDEIPPPFEDETLTRTTFELMNWRRLSVLHGQEVRILCLNDEGQAGHLPRAGV